MKLSVLLYDPSINRFKLYSGVIIHDLSLYFSTWELDQWKKNKNDGTLLDRQGKTWTLIYDECIHKCFNCPDRCSIYYLLI